MTENIPIYQQIISYIKEYIDNGIYQKGNIIPSEQEFCNQFNTSRMTVRKAIDELVNDGYLYRIQGRGTFVSHWVYRKSLEVLGFSYHMKQLGYNPTSRIISFEVIISQPSVAERLKILPTEKVFYLSRVRMADLEPIAIENVYLPEKRFPGLETYSFEENSLYEILKTKYNAEVMLKQEKIHAVMVAGDDAKILFGKEKGVGMRMSGVDFDANMTPVAYADSIYHGTKYIFDVIFR